MQKAEKNHKLELLALLKLFKGNKFLDFSYEEKDGRWALHIHLSNCVIQIIGNRKHLLRDTLYVSPIIDVM
jgi:hypothetical protein